MNTDFDHSVKRLTESEECRARATGFATNQQGQAINRQFRPQLADALNADRVYARRDKAVWRALRGKKNDDLSIDLLAAGVTVCWAEGLGVDSDGEKNFRDIALWIGHCLGQRGELALRSEAGAFAC